MWPAFTYCDNSVFDDVEQTLHYFTTQLDRPVIYVDICKQQVNTSDLQPQTYHHVWTRLTLSPCSREGPSAARGKNVHWTIWQAVSQQSCNRLESLMIMNRLHDITMNLNNAPNVWRELGNLNIFYINKTEVLFQLVYFQCVLPGSKQRRVNTVTQLLLHPQLLSGSGSCSCHYLSSRYTTATTHPGGISNIKFPWIICDMRTDIPAWKHSPLWVTCQVGSRHG